MVKITTVVEIDDAFNQLFSLSTLKHTWRRLHKELRELRIRDCVDWIDWSENLEINLCSLRDEILNGSYQPLPPARYELAKSKGSFRVMTMPNIRDALVYRHIADESLRRALPYKVKGAFFSRRHSATPVGKTFMIDNDSYEKFFPIWLRYHEYQTRTLLNEPYEILVTTDITNYFDSIPHELLLEYLAPLGLPRKAIALLGRLLEILKPTAGHSPNPRVGIPVDELDCSRQLAHIFLFEHDHRIIKEIGEDHYVRFMDDQNIGVKDGTEVRFVVNLLTRSLAMQRLTLNAGKTRFLTPEQVANPVD